MVQPFIGYVACSALISGAALAAPNRVRDVPTPVIALTTKDIDNLSSGRNLSDVIRTLPCRGQSIPSILSPATAQGQIGALTCVKPDDPRMVDIYLEHARVRSLYGSQPIIWDPELARGAAAYAPQMSVRGLVHSPREGRTAIRENLQRMPRGRSGTDLMSVWVSESRNFIPGTFPNVSRTGDWSNVAHYTQMIWPTTSRLGCGIYTDSRYDWVVCRYSPPGNRDGTYIADHEKPDLRQSQTPAANAGSSPPAPQPPSPPPPPPPPTARDPAPDGNEARHPLASYFTQAYSDHRFAVYDGTKADEEAALAKMRYALEELRKRLKAARKAGKFSTVDPDNVQETINTLERLLKAAETWGSPGERG